ncbi:hypothetical protein FLONG3_7233 [Fusarium longipes]|uniref:Uncharacterized protein n=1 Tax=Fusarium longipes TaxID=694270 RepID=A0A395SFX6_9HYPO|nr:hypothetical protein FLONG3_7233 [Fusarium longipes]
MQTRRSTRIASHQEDAPAAAVPPETPKLRGQKRNAAGSAKPSGEQVSLDNSRVARALATPASIERHPGSKSEEEEEEDDEEYFFGGADEDEDFLEDDEDDEEDQFDLDEAEEPSAEEEDDDDNVDRLFGKEVVNYYARPLRSPLGVTRIGRSKSKRRN